MHQHTLSINSLCSPRLRGWPSVSRNKSADGLFAFSFSLTASEQGNADLQNRLGDHYANKPKCWFGGT